MQASLFISILLVGFFISNYSRKYNYSYQRQKVFNIEFIISVLLEIGFLVSLIINNSIMMYITSLSYLLVMIYELIEMIRLVNLLKDKYSNKEVILISMRHIFNLMGAMLLFIEYLIVICLKKIKL